jgi:predicted Zn-dependent peptidase
VLAAELERSVNDPATAAELERSRENLKGRMVLSLESTAARMSHLGSAVLHGMPVLSIDALSERVEAVGLEQLRELAHDLYQPAALSAAGVGPDEAAFRAALEPLGVQAVDGASQGEGAQALAAPPGPHGEAK